MTEDEARAARLTSGDVASRLGIDRSTVLRIPRLQLDYAVTPGGHRRYRAEDVRTYARDVLGLPGQ